MNKNFWKPDDPVWMAEREQEWAQVKANLDKMDPVFPKSSQRFHKQLFFEGTLDPILSDSPTMMRENIKPPWDGCLAMFRMWYLPEKNLDYFKEIFFEEPDITSLSHARGLFMNRFHLGLFPTEYGMFGGREELIVKTYFPGLDYKEEIEQGRRKFTYSFDPRGTLFYCVDHTSAVLASSSVNPFSPGQYLWEHMSYNFDHYPDECFREEKDEPRLRRCLRKVLDWNDRPDAPKERANAVELRNTLFEKFESEDFPAPLLRYWKEEKSAYENGEPYPE